MFVNPAVKWYGGIQNNIRFKNFELDFLIQFVDQISSNYRFGANPAGTSTGTSFGPSNSGNQPHWVLDRWQKPGDEKSYQRFGSYISMFTPWLNSGF